MLALKRLAILILCCAVTWGAGMWGSIICLVVGSALLLGAIFAKRFYVGLKSRVTVPSWQGRIWFVISGGLLLLAGLEGFLGPSRMGLRHFLERAFVKLDFGYEMYVGVIAFLVGAAFVFAGKGKTDRTGRWLGAGAIFGGLVLIGDSLSKLR
jgi:hypothetical protein